MRILGSGVVAALLVAATTNVIAMPAAANPASSNSDWQARVARTIAEDEYHLSVNDEIGGFSAPNRAHDLRACWSPDGALALESRTAPGAWSFSYRLLGVGRGAATSALQAVRRENVSDGCIDWDRQDLREWYVNDARGIAQGFVLESRPAGDPSDPLIIAGAIEGLLAFHAGDGLSVVFRTPAGRDAMYMRDVSVVDADGHAVSAGVEIGLGTLALKVYDRAAVYPLTVSSLMTSSAWTAESDQADAHFGWSVATAGDVNGDGYSDVIVGAFRYDNGESEEGRAFVYLGSSAGLAATPAWIAEGNQVSAMFGYSVATAGDVNGDGYSDVIVGAWLFDNVETNEGRAFVYLGSPAGLEATASWTAESNQVGAYLGNSVAAAGDVNDDGYADVIVGAQLYSNGESREGRVLVYLGSISGLQATAAWSAESNQAEAMLGSVVAAAGDVNGDGYADVIVSARFYDNGESDEGRAFLYLGSTLGLAATAAWTAESDQIDARFGVVAPAGDVNRDGYADVIVAADYYDNGEGDEGLVSVYLGSATGLAVASSWSAEGDEVAAHFGYAVATAGDFNGDGYSDIVVGAPSSMNDDLNEGQAFVYLGSPSGLAATPAWTAEGNQVDAQLGISVAGAGDVNADGFSDIAVGSWRYTNGEMFEGRAFVYLGSRCDLAFADLTFPPLAPAKVAPWVYTQTCAGANILATVLLPSVANGADVDTLGGGPGALRFYQLSCGCADGIYLTKQAGRVRLDLF